MISIQQYFILDQKPKLAIIANKSIMQLNIVFTDFNERYQLPCISINKELSQYLISVSNKELSISSVEWLNERLDNIKSDFLLMKDIDLLFEPCLKLDPLTIFRRIRRKISLLVLWPGDYDNNRLSYGVPEHNHYRYWLATDVEFISM
jgi:hypothetical protein